MILIFICLRMKHEISVQHNAQNINGNLMTKSDKSKHDICIVSIKRSTIKPYEFKWTKFYETNSDYIYGVIHHDLSETELMICTTIIDADNYSILTTQRLVTKQNGRESSGNIDGATDKLYGDFKGYKDKNVTLGKIQLQDGNELKYFIETGNASMIMIHGIRTLIRTQAKNPAQVDNLIRSLNKRITILLLKLEAKRKIGRIYFLPGILQQ